MIVCVTRCTLQVDRDCITLAISQDVPRLLSLNTSIEDTYNTNLKQEVSTLFLHTLRTWNSCGAALAVCCT